MNHVFISYRHDNDAHAANVRNLGDSLKAASLPVTLDQLYVEERPGGPDGGWANWCLENAKESACVLIVCSQGWFDAAEGNGPEGEGLGVAAEARILQTRMYRNKSQNARVRLVILDDFDEKQIPDELYGWTVFKPSAAQGEGGSEQMQRWIRQRLAMPSSSGSQASKVVYLAECRFDLRIERANISDYLKTAGWKVLPAEERTPQPFDHDLRESLAFVQLLESYPREDGSHHAQLARANDSHTPCFRFRHDKVRPGELEEAHRAFATEPDVRTGGFDDFKLNLLKELEAICASKHAPRPYASRDILVRVAIRASEPDPLWDTVFSWVDAQPGIRPALLEGSESFKEKHDPKVPCHGFLIVCDHAVEEGAASTKADLEQCMQIQLGERNEMRRPPVGIVFWPPPAQPNWPRLLRVSPPKLHRIVANAAGDVQAFFQEVRRCAS